MTPVDYPIGSNFDVAFQALQRHISDLNTAFAGFMNDFKTAFIFVAVALTVLVVVLIFVMMRSE